MTLQIGGQFCNASPMLLEKAGEIGALQKRQPKPFHLNVGNDGTSVGSFAHAERSFYRPSVRIFRIDNLAVDYDIVSGSLDRAGYFRRLAPCLSKYNAVYESDRVIAERRDEGFEILFGSTVRIRAEREHSD